MIIDQQAEKPLALRGLHETALARWKKVPTAIRKAAEAEVARQYGGRPCNPEESVVALWRCLRAARQRKESAA